MQKYEALIDAMYTEQVPPPEQAPAAAKEAPKEEASKEAPKEEASKEEPPKEEPKEEGATL